MHRISIIALLCIMIAGQVMADVVITKLSPEDAKQWLCYAMPLPKQIEFTKATLALPGSVDLVINADGKHPIYDQIRKEHTDFYKPDADTSSNPLFRITIQVGGEQAEPLKKLRNSDQAYQIIPAQDSKSLVIVALSPYGAYYGWKTVYQLVTSRWDGAVIRIPVLTVTDWPDMDRRGLWGTDNYYHADWLSNIKMNHMEQIADRGADNQGNFIARIRQKELDMNVNWAGLAVHYVPVLLHLEQHWDANIVEKFYPQVKAKNATKAGALCYSEPKTTEMIAEFIYQLAKQSTTSEVDVWMSENMGGLLGCQCEGCKKENHTVNEARVIVAAWEMAKKKLGKYITIYALTSEATESFNKQIFTILPKDVRVCYYHSLLTYSTIRMQMLRPYLSDYIKEGRWLGVCPNLDAWTHNNVPFPGAQFINYRMSEYVTKGVQGLLGYATPRVHYNAFNVEAAAEWAWNLKGRTTQEFAYSYAVRKGYKKPTQFAEWSETLGPVAWDVYGSNWPAGQKRGHGVMVNTALKEGTLPELGYILWDSYPTPWGGIKTEKQLDDDVAAAGKAIELARDMAIPQIMYETMIIDGYIRTIKALYELKKLAPKGGAFSVANQGAARGQLKLFLTAADQVKKYLPKWDSSITTEYDKTYSAIGKPMVVITEVTDNLKKAVAEMGVTIE